MDTSRFRRDFPPLNLVVLPTYCAAVEESQGLVEKREARLRWMREQGLTYLGDPIDKRETRPQWQPNAPTAHLVSFRRHWEQRAEAESQPRDDRRRRAHPPARSTGE